MSRIVLHGLFSLPEARTLVRLGIPVFIAQMSQMGMAFVDTAMTGQAGAEDMAAVAVAASVWNPVMLFGLGCLLSLPPLSAQLVGGGECRKTAHLMRQGIWLTAMLSVLLMTFFQIISRYFTAFGLEPRLAELAGGYLRAMLWGLPGLFLFVNVRSFLEGFSRTRPAMIIGVLGLILNVPCNYVLIYGKLGFPALGAVGCGVASAFSYWFMALCMIFYVRRDASSKSMGPLFAPLWRSVPDEKRIDWAVVRRIVRVGLPGALAILFEVSLFAVTALLLAPLGTTTVAGHQIAMNFGGVLFMVPLSLGITATIRVGYCLGAGRMRTARTIAWTAMIMGICCATLNALLTVFFREQIVLVYNTDPAVVVLAAHLLLYAAAFQVMDAAQAVSIGVLRGYNDTRVISAVCFVAYWVIGLPVGYALARTHRLGEPWGAAGFWLAYLLALGFGALCYIVRILYLHRQDAAKIRSMIGR